MSAHNHLLHPPSQEEVDVFVMVARTGNAPAVAAFIQRHKTYIDAQDYGGRTALMYAARFGHNTVVRLLIEHGADVNLRGHGGFTPLILAAAAGFETTVKLLVERGARVEEKSANCKTAFGLAVRNHHVGIIVFLAERLSSPSTPKGPRIS